MPRTILIVEPDEAVGALMASILQEWDEDDAERYDTVTVRSLAEAVSVLKHRKVDLIITEAMDQNGVFDFNPSFLRVITSVAANTPIILCSSCPSVEVMQSGEHGLARVIAKPFEVEDFRRRIDKLLAEC